MHEAKAAGDALQGWLGYKRRMRAIRFLPAALLLLSFPARAQDVMSLVRADRWAEAEAAAAQYPDAMARKLVTYFRLLAPGGAGAAEIARFMADSPDWPAQAQLARRRDEALVVEADDAVVSALCAAARPASAPALLRCADAAHSASRAAEAAGFARAAWVAGVVDAAWEARFLGQWGPVLDRETQWRRFDRLAWTDLPAARRQLPRLAPADRRLADVRIALRADEPGAAALVPTLPPALQADPILLLERARWLRRAGQDEAAVALWRQHGTAAERAAPSERQAAFWEERNLLARRRLRDGDSAGAYALAAGHAQGVGENFLDAEFLAGFIALRKLNDKPLAEKHFRALVKNSNSVITQGRGNYWLARSLTDPAAIRAAYAAAASYPGSFYGQLAALALDPEPVKLAARIAAAGDPPADRGRGIDWSGRELARAAAMLASWGDKRRAQAFLLRLDETAADGGDRTLSARLATGLGMPETAVAISRRAGRDGVALLVSGWPLAADVPANSGTEPALALGVMRQESNFDTAVVSTAGARGLMQLMPGTATQVSRRLGLPVNLAGLTADPAYNIRLGTAYLAELMDRFSGCIPFAVAGYNAGPGRVSEWIATYGDPRGTDMLDWLEQIPFSETRNYVQRVVENIVIYRARRGEARPHPLATCPL